MEDVVEILTFRRKGSCFLTLIGSVSTNIFGDSAECKNSISLIETDLSPWFGEKTVMETPRLLMALRHSIFIFELL